MITMVFQQSVLGLVRLLATAAVAGWVGSPMSWSPDARWLGYTIASDPAPAGPRPGGLFDPGPASPEGPGRGEGSTGPWEGPGTYRIWASQRDGAASVLIAESPWPLTSPRWGPRGRSLAFGRFAPDSMAPRGHATRGRLEVIVQEGMDRKRTLISVPEFELDDEARAHFPHVQPAWSPDGQYLAVPSPGRSPSLHIVRVETRRVVKTLEAAALPSWSPDGTKLAYVHRDAQGDFSLMLLERRGQAFGGPRAVVPIGRVASTPGWGGDGRSILAVAERTRLRFPDLDLVRVSTENGETNTSRVLSLVPQGLPQMAAVRGLAIDFDRNEELCFFAVALDGRESAVCWSIPREQLTYKRFHPVDSSLPIGSLAIAPDGHAVAIRFGTPEGLSPPAVCELETERVPPTEHTLLIVPDEAARRAWSGILARTARSLLGAVVPPAVVDGKPVVRPASLPLPEELPAAFPVRPRLARLGRLGASLEPTGHRPDAEAEADLEDRLFFDYLRGDYKAAMADLESLEARTDARPRRLALLGLRAMILRAQGETDAAREVADYLLDAAGGAVHRVEETPLGRSLVPEPAPERDWARYLVMRTSLPPVAAPPASEPGAGDRDDAFLGNPFTPFGPPGMDLQRDRIPGDALPFVPNLPGGQRDEMMRLQFLRLQQQLQLDAQKRLPQAPPLPRPLQVRPMEVRPMEVRPMEVRPNL